MQWWGWLVVFAVTGALPAAAAPAKKAPPPTAASIPVPARPQFLREVADALGSQCVVLSVEAKRRGEGRWEALTDNGREKTGLDVVEWVARGEQLGAGEIMLTSVDMEGTRRGFDLALLRAVRARVRIPVIASGGAGSAAQVAAVATAGTADGVAVASLFHYGTMSVPAMKRALAESGVAVRP